MRNVNERDTDTLLGFQLTAIDWTGPDPARPLIPFSRAQASGIDSVGTEDRLLIPPILQHWDLEFIRRPDSESREVLSASPTDAVTAITPMDCPSSWGSCSLVARHGYSNHILEH